jgi:hypothetical protein
METNWEKTEKIPFQLTFLASFTTGLEILFISNFLWFPCSKVEEIFILEETTEVMILLKTASHTRVKR